MTRSGVKATGIVCFHTKEANGVKLAYAGLGQAEMRRFINLFL